jgi:hypothetical protein
MSSDTEPNETVDQGTDLTVNKTELVLEGEIQFGRDMFFQARSRHLQKNKSFRMSLHNQVHQQ